MPSQYALQLILLDKLTVTYTTFILFKFTNSNISYVEIWWN